MPQPRLAEGVDNLTQSVKELKEAAEAYFKRADGRFEILFAKLDVQTKTLQDVHLAAALLKENVKQHISERDIHTPPPCPPLTTAVAESRRSMEKLKNWIIIALAATVSALVGALISVLTKGEAP